MLSSISNNLNRSLADGYRFRDLPDGNLLYQVRIAINNSNLWDWQIQSKCPEYIHLYTIKNLMNGKTQRPQLRTVQIIMQALGYHLTWKKGN